MLRVTILFLGALFLIGLLYHDEVERAARQLAGWHGTTYFGTQGAARGMGSMGSAAGSTFRSTGKRLP